MACLGCLGSFFFPVIGTIAFVLTIIGFFKPEAVIRWGDKRTKAQAIMLYGSICAGSFLFFIISVITTASSVPTSTATTPGAVTRTTPRAAETKAATSYAMNDWFECGDFRYSITGAQSTRQIGTEFSKETPSEGAMFIVLFFTEENMSKATKTVSNSRFYIVDSQGREFRSASKGTMAMMMQYKTELSLSEVQPGVKHKSVVLYELPEDATGLKVKIPAGFGNPEVNVPLTVN